jgi:hypothetical protein
MRVGGLVHPDRPALSRRTSPLQGVDCGRANAATLASRAPQRPRTSGFVLPVGGPIGDSNAEVRASIRQPHKNRLFASVPSGPEPSASENIGLGEKNPAHTAPTESRGLAAKVPIAGVLRATPHPGESVSGENWRRIGASVQTFSAPDRAFTEANRAAQRALRPGKCPNRPSVPTSNSVRTARS